MFVKVPFLPAAVAAAAAAAAAADAAAAAAAAVAVARVRGLQPRLVRGLQSSVGVFSPA